MAIGGVRFCRLSRVTRLYVSLISMLLMPLCAAAQDVEAEPPDARLEGYGKVSPVLDSNSTALTWLLLVGLGVLCISVMFKDAKRTHLD